MTVYLNHLDDLLNPDRPAQHYLGHATRLRVRLEQHARSWIAHNGNGPYVVGGGARILAWANSRGIGWTLVRTWAGGTKDLERYLKHRYKNSRSLCPVCNPGTRAGLNIDGYVEIVRWSFGQREVNRRYVRWSRPRLHKPRLRFRREPKPDEGKRPVLPTSPVGG